MTEYLKIINGAIERTKTQGLLNPELVSDGFHTFKELYNFRKLYNALLFNEWSKQGIYKVHKSIKHFDNELCFGGDWFVVMAILPTGQISNHYHIDDWPLFNIDEYPKALFAFDGHSSEDVAYRLETLLQLA